MKREESAFFELLRCGLWEREIENFSLFPLSDSQWMWVYKQSIRQTVQGLLYRGFQYLPEEFFPPESILLRWIVEINHIENRNLRTERVIETLYKRFEVYGIRPVLQKGQGVAMMYVHPELRVCGDIDFYFLDKKSFKFIKRILKEDGVEIHTQADGSYEYFWEGIQVEHHSMLIDLQNPFAYPSLRKLEEMKGFEEAYINKDFLVKVPEPSLNVLMLDTHIMKHAFILGIGLRQFCDLARAYYIYGQRNKIDGDELERIYKKLGIKKWSTLLHSFLVEYIGLSESILPYKEVKLVESVTLLNLVLNSGNFGQHIPEWKTASRNFISRKLYTFKTMYRNRKVSFKYASFETVCKFIHLLLGQANE
jgi:predicted transcriptional regulator